MSEVVNSFEGDFFNSQAHGVIKSSNKIAFDTRKDADKEQIKMGVNYRQVLTLYHGEAEYGQRKGKGVLIFKWIGSIHKNVAEKCGLLNQAKYIGEFSDNKMNGYGTLVYENGKKHIGYFKDNNRMGLGMEVNPVAEHGKNIINKGIFDGDSRIGPNWADISTLNAISD